MFDGVKIFSESYGQVRTCNFCEKQKEPTFLGHDYGQPVPAGNTFPPVVVICKDCVPPGKLAGWLHSHTV